MLDLIFGYLLIIILLFSVNIGLFLGYFKFNDKKNTFISIMIGIILLIVMAISSILTINLLDYLSYVFILISIIIFSIFYIYLKKDNLRLSLFIIIFIYYVIVLMLSSQLGENSLFNYSLAFVSIIMMIVTIQLSKLLIYAKRPYNVIIFYYATKSWNVFFIFNINSNLSVNLCDYRNYFCFNYWILFKR